MLNLSANDLIIKTTTTNVFTIKTIRQSLIKVVRLDEFEMLLY